MKYNGNDSGGFWARRIKLVCDKMIPLQLDILKDIAPGTEPSHAIENFRIAAGLSSGSFYGMVFQDSDVGKWIESAAYKLMLMPDPVLEKEIDDIVDIIGKAQQPDGYLNTYFTVKEPGKRWTNLAECHELYCAGHLMEGAVAYYQATGKRSFLDIMCRMADHIDSVIGPEEGKLHGYPGHPEAEIGLYRLYKATGEKRYLALARYFIDRRGQQPSFFEEERNRDSYTVHFKGMRELGPEYMQSHKPVREQTEAVGHSVRALYLYTAMADIAAETGDESLFRTCETLWDNIISKKMYITGSFGATVTGEAFSGNYELPNDTAYAETCASVAAVFFAMAMLRSKRKAVYADVIERALYNTVLAGISLDADRFFYVNPLEVSDGVSGVLPGYKHVLPKRPGWFACACCPPNVARLMASLPDYCYQDNGDEIVIHQYLDGSVSLKNAEISMQSNYPWDGGINWTVRAAKDISLVIRIPGWAESYTLKVDGRTCSTKPEEGYVSLQIPSGVTLVSLNIDMHPVRWHASPLVRQDAGRVAFTYGPLVYCIEQDDQEEPVCTLRAGSETPEMSPYEPETLGGIRFMNIPGRAVIPRDGCLYSSESFERRSARLKAIPYYAWANREKTGMEVWIPED